MHKLMTAIAIFLCLLITLTGCDTLNVGPGPKPADWGNMWVNMTITPATSFNEGEAATATVTWVSGTSPHTIAIDVGTDQNVPAGTETGASPFTWDFTLVEGSQFTWTVTLTDATGNSNTMNGTYGPVGPPLNDRPEITNVAVAGGVVTVTVSDTEGDDVTVSVTDITGLYVPQNSVVVTGGNGDAVFTFTASDPMVGGSGTPTITAWDARHENDPVTDTATIAIDFPGWLPAEGQIIAHAMAGAVSVGDTVTVLVLAGDFPAGAAFAYMNGVAVTVTDGGNYVDDTFNVGSIGGSQKDVDGIWADMAPAPQTFFVPENFMMKAVDLAADSSLDFMGFNVTPIGAGEVYDGGDLFNFGIAFDAPGTYQLGFLEFQDVKRTYYSDLSATEFNWVDISNEWENITNTITVE